jgi:soluble lytic murein transglycosylase-like protein
VRSSLTEHTIDAMKFTRKLPAAVSLLLLSATPVAAGDIYVGTEERDSVVLSNVPAGYDFAVVVQAPIESEPVVSLRPVEHIVGPRAAKAVIERAAAYASLVDDAARETQVDPGLLHAVIATESAYNPAARSPKGAQGLMQLMPATARRYGVVNAYEPRHNILGGARYLADLLVLFDQDVQLALAAYNAGEQAVLRHGRRIPPYRETGAYVPRVLDYYRVFSKNSL